MTVLLANPALYRVPIFISSIYQATALAIHKQPGLLAKFPTQRVRQLLEQRHIIVYWDITSQAHKFEGFRSLTKCGHTPDSNKPMHSIKYNRPVLKVAEGQASATGQRHRPASQASVTARHIKESEAINSPGFKFACVFKSLTRLNAAGVEDACQEFLQKPLKDGGLQLGLRLLCHVAKRMKVDALEGLMTTTFMTYATVDAFTYCTDKPTKIACIMVKGIKLNAVH